MDQMITSARMTENALGLKQNYTTLVCLDTNYIAGQMMLVRSFVTGMNIVAVEPTANPLSSIPDDLIIDFAAFVPYQLQTMLTSDRQKLNRIGMAIIGGAMVDPILANQLINLSCQFYATYGMTETISHVALKKLNGSNADEEFRILPGVSIRTDHRECLNIKTSFLENEVVTNDIVELKGSNQFQWLGRWDNVINSGGVKVIPEKIERKLTFAFDQLQLDNRFFVAGLPDLSLGHKVCLVMEGNKPNDHQLEKLWEKIREVLPKYETPKEIRWIKKFNETRTGKVKRLETLNLFPA